MAEVGRRLWRATSPTLLRARAAWMPGAVSAQGLSISRNGDNTASLGSLFLCSITLFLSLNYVLTVLNGIDGMVKLWSLSLLSLLYTTSFLLTSKWQSYVLSI